MPNVRSWKQCMSVSFFLSFLYVSYAVIFSYILGPIKYTFGPKPKHESNVNFHLIAKKSFSFKLHEASFVTY